MKVKYQKSTANLPRWKFAISVGFDYQLEWMVMHNGADLTKLRLGIPFVCSQCKRKRGPRDHPPDIEGRVHDTCRQKLVIRLYAARFGNPSYIEFEQGGDICAWLQENVLSMKNINWCVSIQKSFFFFLEEQIYVESVDNCKENDGSEKKINRYRQ